MAYELKTIKNQLKTAIATASAAILPVKLYYAEAKPSQFPAAMLLWGGETAEQKDDSIYNTSTATFILRLHFVSDPSETHQDALYDAIDAVKDILRKDDYQTLSGNALDVVVGEVTPIQASDGFTQPVWYVDIPIYVKRIKPINA